GGAAGGPVADGGLTRPEPRRPARERNPLAAPVPGGAAPPPAAGVDGVRRAGLGRPPHAPPGPRPPPRQAGPLPRPAGAGGRRPAAGRVPEAALPPAVVARRPGGTAARRRLVARVAGVGPPRMGPRPGAAGADGGGRRRVHRAVGPLAKLPRRRGIDRTAAAAPGRSR